MVEYHVPVLLQASLDGLAIRPNGTYVDLTFGGGGHSKAILNHLSEQGKLIAFDQDEEAAEQAQAIQHRSFTFWQANFRYLKRFLKLSGVQKVDGILADLGVSSHQFDVGERGFSTRFDGPLDMRMNRQQEKTAAHVLNTYDEKDLVHLFSLYGEVRNAKSLARAIVVRRSNQELKHLSDLREVAITLAPRGKENKYLAQVYQSIRIEVNEEMESLRDMLDQAASLLSPRGRLVLISYHSLEDRLVKNFLRSGRFSGDPEKDLYGNMLRPLKPLSNKPVLATDEELQRNPRARSARLRIGEKLKNNG